MQTAAWFVNDFLELLIYYLRSINSIGPSHPVCDVFVEFLQELLLVFLDFFDDVACMLFEQMKGLFAVHVLTLNRIMKEMYEIHMLLDLGEDQCLFHETE